ncbi:hypothetical protein OPT61_g8671 [Boeremia exigua]|uniref:Uncharacterized protein n=1 Tax=Boeremia exigua TaxID=749465 RepID=A0ACC2HY52_9PLEO|nr:hypothetical protein OPT61_g8671 [Boeremia exigua]
MRFNAVIAAAVLAATVSGAAIAKPAPEATETTEEAPADDSDIFFYAEGEDEDSVSKREAEADPQWVWSPKFRPPGLPVGKREAEAGKWVWSPKFRPPGLPVGKTRQRYKDRSILSMQFLLQTEPSMAQAWFCSAYMGQDGLSALDGICTEGVRWSASRAFLRTNAALVQNTTMAAPMLSRTPIPRFLLPQSSWTSASTLRPAASNVFEARRQRFSTAPERCATRSVHTALRRQHMLQSQKQAIRVANRYTTTPGFCRNFSATGAQFKDHHFDTLKFIQRLKEEGFTDEQAEGMMRVLGDVIEESIQNLTRTMVLREDQEKATYTQKVDFAKLRSELMTSDSTESSLTRASHERLTNELAKLNSRLRDEIQRTQASVRLDLNLEKGRIREEANVQELKLKETETRIEQETAQLRERLEAVKFSTLQWLMGVCTGTAALMLGVWRHGRTVEDMRRAVSEDRVVSGRTTATEKTHWPTPASRATAAAQPQFMYGMRCMDRRWTRQRVGTPAIPLLWYQEGTAFVATLKATRPSYDAITGKQPASCSVSRCASIGSRTVIDDVHPEMLHVCEWPRISSLFYAALIGPRRGMAHQPDSLAAARCSVTWCDSGHGVGAAGGGNRLDGSAARPEQLLSLDAPTICVQYTASHHC